jgi:hypothetical protein
VRTVTTKERRARLAIRHRLAPGHGARDVVEAADSLVALHATSPDSVYLSAWARVDGMELADMDRALYEDRALVKHLAMRRTLFVFPRESLGFVQAGASNRVAAAERRRLIRDVEKAGLQRDGGAWLRKAERKVLEKLGDGRELSSTELRREIPLLEGSIEYGKGKSWGGQLPIGPRVLTVLSAAGRIARGTNAGAWTVSRPLWTSTAAWLGEEIPGISERDGTARLVERWLRAFGPGTAGDVKWWLGSTVAAVRRALADLDAVEVNLEGDTGYLLPDDLEPIAAPEPWAALLPALDPTTMGWFERDWYLAPLRDQIFDRNGNGGNTAWWDGRIVGGWRQAGDGTVELQLLEDVGSDAKDALAAEAGRLTSFLAGHRPLPRFPSPLSKA